MDFEIGQMHPQTRDDGGNKEKENRADTRATRYGKELQEAEEGSLLQGCWRIMKKNHAENLQRQKKEKERNVREGKITSFWKQRMSNEKKAAGNGRKKYNVVVRGEGKKRRHSETSMKKTHERIKIIMQKK